MRALLLLVFLAPACSVYAQTRIWIEAGLNRHTTHTAEYQPYNNGPFYDAQKFNYTSSTFGLRLEQYLNYNFALVSGIHTWNYELNSGRKEYVIEDHVLTPVNYSNDDETRVRPKAKWRTTYLTVPIGI